MQDCWQANPQDRPSFEALKEVIEHMQDARKVWVSYHQSNLAKNLRILFNTKFIPVKSSRTLFCKQRNVYNRVAQQPNPRIITRCIAYYCAYFVTLNNGP